jgi:transcriptional regulator with XRE-family HTH domain
MSGDEFRNWRGARTQKVIAAELGASGNTVARWERGEMPIPHWVHLLIEAERQFSARFAEAEAAHTEAVAKLTDTIEKQCKEATRLNEKIIELTWTKQERQNTNRLAEENRWLAEENKRLRRRLSRAERKLRGLDELDEILGIGGHATNGSASPEAVYKRLARKYHPDHNPQHAEVMKDLNELWQAARRE